MADREKVTTMQKVFFTSDTHFGHKRIIELCDRPFKDVTHMNEMLVHNWNSVVMPEDRVYHLGDVALGPILESLEYISRLNGEIILIDGNHDRRFMAKNDEQRAKWERVYLDAGFSAIHNSLALYNFDFLPMVVNLSHFPYEGDSHDGDRFESIRLEDKGIPLLHGHTHSSGDPVSWSTKRGEDKKTIQVHVGMDAWNYTPVSAEQLGEIFSANGFTA